MGRKLSQCHARVRLVVERLVEIDGRLVVRRRRVLVASGLDLGGHVLTRLHAPGRPDRGAAHERVAGSGELERGLVIGHLLLVFGLGLVRMAPLPAHLALRELLLQLA